MAFVRKMSKTIGKEHKQKKLAAKKFIKESYGDEPAKMRIKLKKIEGTSKKRPAAEKKPLRKSGNKLIEK
jgi:hypothetical protein